MEETLREIVEDADTSTAKTAAFVPLAYLLGCTRAEDQEEAQEQFDFDSIKTNAYIGLHDENAFTWWNATLGTLTSTRYYIPEWSSNSSKTVEEILDVMEHMAGLPDDFIVNTALAGFIWSAGNHISRFIYTTHTGKPVRSFSPTGYLLGEGYHQMKEGVKKAWRWSRTAVDPYITREYSETYETTAPYLSPEHRGLGAARGLNERITDV